MRRSLVLAVASTLLTLLAIERWLFPLVLPLLPLRVHVYLPSGARLLAQPSKRSTLPHDYVAVTGDSYAQGAGDWLLEVGRIANPPFQATHLLHERTGRDVVGLGRGGAGSLGGWIAEPVGQYLYVNSLWGYRLEEPANLVAYFYEGNDLQENLLEALVRLRAVDSPIGEPAIFRRFVEEVVLPEHEAYRDSRSPMPWTHLLFASFARRASRELNPFLAPLPVPGVDAGGVPPSRGEVGVFRIAGRPFVAPDGIQGPALELTASETRLGLRIAERSLAYLRDAFPRSALCVVYVPSPLSSYSIISKRVSIQPLGDRRTAYRAERVRRRSDALARRVARIAERQAVRFVDARNEIRIASADRPLHGPRDWKHLNRAGYSALADAVLRCLGGTSGHRGDVRSLTPRRLDA